MAGNTKEIDATIASIRKHDIGFTMNAYIIVDYASLRPCRTMACIAGHVLLNNGNTALEVLEVSRMSTCNEMIILTAAELLGLSEEVADELFIPCASLAYIEEAQAIRMLEFIRDADEAAITPEAVRKKWNNIVGR